MLTSLKLVSLLALVVVLLNDSSQAQTPTNLTVQQPTVRGFRSSTSVYVPAGGSLSLGAIGQSRYGTNRFGSPLSGRFPGLGVGLGNRAAGRSTLASGVSLTATITDHAAIDRALLAEAARRRGATHDVLGRPITSLPNRSNADYGRPHSSEKRSTAPSAEALWNRGR